MLAKNPIYSACAKMMQLPAGSITVTSSPPQGGVSSPGDIARLREIPALYGAIIGKALYDGAVKLPEVVITGR